jgi:cysteine-rich repeat protein
MRTGKSVSFMLLTLTGCFVGSATDEQLASVDQGARVRGAIFTTLPDGSAVNHNIYDAKTDVYLDGGPAGGSPSSAAALDEGDYYFQVTDPGGKVLLSSDDITCRRVHISGDGVITAVVGACRHVTGVDQDYASLGAITVQLMPYTDTPNRGGVYKVWMTPVAAYVGGGSHGGVSYGFVHSSSKTDVFKVGDTSVTPPGGGDDNPPPTCSACGDGHLDTGEQCDDGNTTSGDGCSSSCTIETPPPPSGCCGDGHLDSGEQCDDGNTTAGDGCSATCQLEATPEPPGGRGTFDDGGLCDGCVSTLKPESSTVFVP